MTRYCPTVALALALAACGQTTQLKPAPGESMPVRPLMARATPTVQPLRSATSLWSVTDTAVVLAALAIIGLSLAGLFWLLRSS